MMSMPSWALFAVTNSIALITSLVLPAPLSIEDFERNEPRLRRNAPIALS